MYRNRQARIKLPFFDIIKKKVFIVFQKKMLLLRQLRGCISAFSLVNFFLTFL